MKTKRGRWIKRILITLLCVVIIGFAASAGMYYSIMNKHIYTTQNARGLAKLSDYNGLTREESSFDSIKGNKLMGYFYKNQDIDCDKGVIIVNNGFGVGHGAMLGEIDALTKYGYLVYGFDKTGYDDSQGKGIGSLTQGVDDLCLAIDHVKNAEQSEGMNIILYGKSWGAYCCLAVLSETTDVSTVISMSAFNKTSDMIEQEAVRRIGIAGRIFKPFIDILDLVNEKSISAMDGLNSTSARVLILHSMDDETVSIDSSYKYFEKKCRDKDNISFICYDGKGHSIIKSEESEEYNKQMDDDLQVFAAKHDGKMTEELWQEFLSNYDLKKCTEPDPKVMDTIMEFVNQK